MPDTPNLRPATRDELTQSRSFALRFNGRKRVHDADEAMARITAERLVAHLERSGYVAMHKPLRGDRGAGGQAGLPKPALASASGPAIAEGLCSCKSERHCAANLIISRSNVASDPFPRSSRWRSCRPSSR